MSSDAKPARRSQKHLVTLLRRQRLQAAGKINSTAQDEQRSATDGQSQQNVSAIKDREREHQGMDPGFLSNHSSTSGAG